MYRYQVDADGNEGDPTKLNESLIIEDTDESTTGVYFTDYDVVEGETYFYKYKILRTSFEETDYSNAVSAAPLTSTLGDSNGDFDVIVPSSGGKDSAYIAHELKHKYGMNPLTVTWSPHLYTDVGWQNFQGMIHEGNLANILGTPCGKTHRKLTKLSFEILGDPFQPFIYGQANFPMQIAAKYKVPLIMYGENGEVEYGGDAKHKENGIYGIDYMISAYMESGYDLSLIHI